MKKIILLLVIATAIVSCKNEENKTDVPVIGVDAAPTPDALSDSANYTTLQWLDSTDQDLGKIKKGQTVQVSYKLKNTGNKPLIITSVEPGCGCTVAEKPEKPIMPGKEEKIVASFNTENQAVGTQMKHITVRANTQPTTNYTVGFKAEVVE